MENIENTRRPIMKKCTLKQAYYIYKCIDEFSVGYKMKNTRLNNLCQQRKDISELFLKLQKEALHLYKRISIFGEFDNKFCFDINTNQLSFYKASKFIYKVKKLKIENEFCLKKCKECKYNVLCDAYLSNQLLVGGDGSIMKYTSMRFKKQ